MRHRVFRFASVGLLATAIHGVVALGVESSISVSPFVANGVGFAVATLFAFFAHGRWTFRLNGLDPAMFARFLTVGIVGLSVSSFIVFVGEAIDLPFPVVVLAIVATVPPINFLVLQAWVFQDSGKSDSGPPLSLIVALAASLSVFPIFWGQPVNHDTAWYLLATEQWIEGSSLYRETIEVNPPLNFYYIVPAVVVSDWLGLSQTNGIFCVLAILVFAITYWAAQILTHDLGYSRRAGPLLAGGIALALIVPALNAVAQREHSLAILLIPWLLKEATASIRPPGRGYRRAAAVAAFGICLKPYFLVFPAAITVFHAIRTQSFRPFLSGANGTIAVVGLAYVAAVALLHPDYFRTVVPMGMAVYGAYGAPLATVLAGLVDEACFLAILAVAYRRYGQPNPVAAIFWVAACATLVSVVVLGTGFNYHALPAAIF